MPDPPTQIDSDSEDLDNIFGGIFDKPKDQTQNPEHNKTTLSYAHSKAMSTDSSLDTSSFNKQIPDHNSQIPLPTETSAKENINTTRTQTSQSQRVKTKNQISHISFENFVEKYFKEIDYSSFEYITKTRHINLNIKSETNEISNKEMLISALIDDTEFDKNESMERYLKINNTVADDECDYINSGINAFFEENKIQAQVEDNEILRMYKEQIAINNRRKAVLKDNLKRRMIYKSYLAAFKVIDDAMVKLYLKRIKNKKKYKNDEFFQEMNNILSKRRNLKKEINVVEECEDSLFEIGELFVEENVKTKDIGYVRKDFL